MQRYIVVSDRKRGRTAELVSIRPLALPETTFATSAESIQRYINCVFNIQSPEICCGNSKARLYSEGIEYPTYVVLNTFPSIRSFYLYALVL